MEKQQCGEAEIVVGGPGAYVVEQEVEVNDQGQVAVGVSVKVASIYPGR